MIEKQKAFAREHIILNSVQHVAAGFGLAILFQQYFVGNPFVHAAFGWALVAFSTAVHIFEFVRPRMRLR